MTDLKKKRSAKQALIVIAIGFTLVVLCGILVKLPLLVWIPISAIYAAAGILMYLEYRKAR